MSSGSSAVGASISACSSSSLTSDPKLVVLDQCIARLKHVIQQTQWETLNLQFSKLNCPISSEFPKNPVVTKCGHLFERAVIQRWKDQGHACPTCRGDIFELTPVHDLKQFVEDRLPKEPVLTCSNFKGRNPQRAAQCFDMARNCIDEKDEEGALGFLAQGLRYTNSSADYAAVPALYDHVNAPEKASLSRLYLSLYQLQEGKVHEASETLKNCKSDILNIEPLIVGLVLQLSLPSETLDWAKSSALKQNEPEDSIFIYRQILALDPYQFDAHQQLIALTNDPKEKRELCLRAADCAHRAGRSDLETNFHKEGEIAYVTVISKAGWSDPQSIKLPPYPQRLQAFLNGDCTVWPGKKRYETHIVVPLFPDVSLNDEEPPVPLTLETLDQLDKSTNGRGCRNLWDTIPKNVPAKREFRYAVMTNNTIPGSLGSQAEMLPAGYTMPSIFDAARAILWEYRRTGNRYFNDENSYTYTRCCDVLPSGCSVVGSPAQLVVGGFDPNGLYVGVGNDDGFAGWRKF